MKILRTHITLNRRLNASKIFRNKNLTRIILHKNRNSIAGSTIAGLLIFSSILSFYACNKPTDNPTPPVVNPTGCAIASDVDEALGVRNFEYDDKGFLVKMTGPNYYYGPFVRTITPAKVIDAYPSE